MITSKQQDDMNYTVQKSQPIQIRKVEKWSKFDISPTSLRFILSEYGVSRWMDGIFQTCDPSSFDSFLESVLDNHKYIKHQHTIAYGLSAFGQLCVWNIKFGCIVFDFPNLRIMLTEDPRKNDYTLSDNAVLVSIPTNKRSYDTYKIFDRTKERYGELPEDHVYGFFPALSAGGQVRVDNIKITEAIAHFAFLIETDLMSTYFIDIDASHGNQITKLE